MNSLQLTNVKMLPDAAPSVPTIHILPSTQVNDCFVITYALKARDAIFRITLSALNFGFFRSDEN